MEMNSDFQTQLVQINGLLQASITELRYRCEVYRLSLQSICKTLSNVQKEQEARLRCLTTTRPSYQTYLLNLSQKQALDRIGNVVKKASTFIKGYSLVEKKFLPPPLKPSTVKQYKQRISPLFRDEIDSPHSKNSKLMLSSKSEANDEIKPKSRSDSQKVKPWETKSQEEEKKRTTGVRRTSEKTGDKEKSRSISSSFSKSKVGSYKQDRNQEDVGKPERKVGKGEICRQSATFPNLKQREREKEIKESSKSITCQRLQVIKSRGVSNDNSGRRSSDVHRAGLERRRSVERRNLFRTSHVDNGKARAEVRCTRKPSNEIQKSRNKSSCKRENTRSVHLGDRSGSTRIGTTCDKKVRESLAVIRHRHQATSSKYTIQGHRSVSLKCVFSAHNYKHNSPNIQKVRRVVL